MQTSPNASKLVSLIFMLSLIFVTGCSGDFELRTKLLQEERISENAPVFVNGTAAGFVKKLRFDSGERLAVLALTNKSFAQQQIRLGTVRIVEDDRILLRTELVRPDSPALETGAFIPLQSKTEFAVKKYGTQQTLVLVGIVLLAILILCLIFKKVFNLGVVVLCLSLAGLTGRILHPYLVPHVEKFYSSVPAMHKDGHVNEDAPASESETSTAVKEWESKFVQVLEHRPDPRITAFAALLVLSFIPYAILLGGAIRSLRRER